MSARIRSFIVLITYLAIVYNLEKLGQLAGITFSFYPFLYIIITLAVIVSFALTAMKIPLFMLTIGWSGVYLLGRLALYSTDSPFTGIHIYQAVTEVAILAGALALADHAAKELNKLEELGLMITVPNSVNQIRNFNNAIEDIKKEFIRSRRYNHPLSLMVIEPSKYTLKEDLDRIIRENQKRMTRRYLSNRLAEIIIHQARRTDMVLSQNGNERFVILCPENNADGTSILAQRIQADVQNHLGVSIQYGIAAFPVDALTLEDLVRSAETKMGQGKSIDEKSSLLIDMPEPVPTPSGEQPKQS